MIVGIDCRQMLDNSGNLDGGVGRYIFHIARSLIKIRQEHDYRLFVLESQKGNIWLKEFSKEQIVYIPAARWRIPLWHTHFLVSRIINALKCDVVFFPANVIPLGYRGKAAVAVHDLAIYKHPEWFPSGQWFSKQVLVPWSLKKADKIVAVSETTKRDIIEIFGIPESKIHVIYEGVYPAGADAVRPLDKGGSSRRVGMKGVLSSPYILFIGTIQPRKNLIRAMQAFEKLIERGIDQRLSGLEFWIAGKKGWKSESIYKYARVSPVSDRIKFLGEVSEEQKWALLQQSRMLAFVSLYEGFGLPILEAWQAWIPILTSNNTAMAEIGQEASLLVNPYDIEEVTQGMRELLLDESLISKLGEAGRKKVKQFSWEEAASTVRSVLNKVR